MDELDKLALEAQKHPANSKARKKALTKLVMAIQASGKLYCADRYDSPEVYNEALQEVWLYVCQNIDRYDPSKGNAITWVNYTLKWRFRDAADRHLNRKRVSQDNQRKWVQTLSLDAPVKTPDSAGDSGETYLDSIPQETPPFMPADKLRGYIENDPQGIFQHRHIRNHPEANYRTIALFYLENKSWAEIVAEFDNQISYGTVTGFFWRACRHFAPQFQDYLDSEEGLG